MSCFSRTIRIERRNVQINRRQVKFVNYLSYIVVIFLVLKHIQFSNCRRILGVKNHDDDYYGRLSSLSSNCGRRYPQVKNRIAGGTRAFPGEFPSYVYVRIQIHNGYNDCGGTIISDRHVVTAAHCFEHNVQGDTNDKIIEVYTTNGPNPLFYEGDRIIKYNARKACIHSSFGGIHNQTYFAVNDLAIIRTRKRFKFNKFVQPACLPESDFGENYNGRFTIVGLGASTVNNSRINRWLRKLHLKRIDCPRHDDHYGKICFNGIRGTACVGDSGGPMYVEENGRHYVIGAASYTAGKCQKYKKTLIVYSDLFKMRDSLLELLSECGYH